MRLLLAVNYQATRQNEIIKSYLQLGSSSNRYAPRLPQQETKSSTKQLPPTDPILGPENLLKTGFAQKGLPSRCDVGFKKATGAILLLQPKWPLRKSNRINYNAAELCVSLAKCLGSICGFETATWQFCKPKQKQVAALQTGANTKGLGWGGAMSTFLVLGTVYAATI